MSTADDVRSLSLYGVLQLGSRELRSERDFNRKKKAFSIFSTPFGVLYCYRVLLDKTIFYRTLTCLITAADIKTSPYSQDPVDPLSGYLIDTV